MLLRATTTLELSKVGRVYVVTGPGVFPRPTGWGWGGSGVGEGCFRVWLYGPFLGLPQHECSLVFVFPEGEPLTPYTLWRLSLVVTDLPEDHSLLQALTWTATPPTTLETNTPGREADPRPYTWSWGGGWGLSVTSACVQWPVWPLHSPIQYRINKVWGPI